MLRIYRAKRIYVYEGRMASALVVFSGGQDSTTCLYWAKSQYERVHAVTFCYNQRHAIEIDSARKIAAMAGVSHEVIDLGAIFKGLSPLTDHSLPVDHFAVEDSKEPALPSGVATTFVPGRNILFFTIAANRAYVHNVDSIVVGVAQQDYGGYPDCRQDFISKLEAALVSGLDRRLEIVTPLMNMTKKETVELAQSLPGCLDALAYSTTCYEGHFPPCGKCHSCVLRAKGFAEAGVNDPLLERAAVAISKV